MPFWSKSIVYVKDPFFFLNIGLLEIHYSFDYLGTKNRQLYTGNETNI